MAIGLIDGIIGDFCGPAWVIEVKRSTAPTVSRDFHQAAQDVKAQRRLLVAPVAQAYRTTGDIALMATQIPPLVATSNSPTLSAA